MHAAALALVALVTLAAAPQAPGAAVAPSQAPGDPLGLGPRAPLLARIDAAGSLDEVMAAVRLLHETGIAAPFSFRALQSARSAGRAVAEIRPAGLGLPSADLYLNPDARVRDLREAYRVHVAHILELAGATRADSRKAAAGVFAIEKQLARATPRATGEGGAPGRAQRTSFVALTELTPMFDWPAYFKAAKLSHGAVDVYEPEFMRAVEQLLETSPLADWKAYLRWHLLHASAPTLAQPFRDEHARFYETYLGEFARARRP